MKEVISTGPANAMAPTLDYHALVAHVSKTFAGNAGRVLFRTVPQNVKKDEKVASANSVYLDTLPEFERASHNCFTCRGFFKHYSDLVIINEDNTLTSAVWDPTDCPAGYEVVVTALKQRAESGRVSTRFFSETALVGTPENGNPEKGSFEHFHLALPVSAVTGKFSVGDKSHEANTLRELFSKSLGDIKPETLKWAIHQFTYDAQLDTRAAGLKTLERFKEVQEQYKTVPNQLRQNFIWLMSQTLPGGVASITNTALGTFLESVQKATNDHSRRYARDAYIQQTAGDSYMRSTTETSEGGLDAAERLIEKLGVAAAFKRRAATLDDVREWVWEHPAPPVEPESDGGVFGRLRKQIAEAPTSTVMNRRIGWGEFVRDILPQAKSVQVQVPNGNHNFGRMITAVDADAPPILVWDDEEYRNPVSWYIYNEGSPARIWNLSGGGHVKLLGVTPTPVNWGGKRFPQWHESHMLVLEGAREVNAGTLGLFPEILKRELYPARNAIDNLSRQTPLERMEEGEFAGIIITKGLDATSVYLRLIVELPTGIVTFEIVRWTE